MYKEFSFIVSVVSHECHFDIDRYVYYASYVIIIYTTPSSGEGWLDRVSSTVFVALGLGGRSVSFGDRNASLGEFRFEGNCYPEML